jgi:NADH-quinone oxidoreductase subunit J
MEQTLLRIAFYGFAAMTVFSALAVALTRRVVHAAFALLFTFFGVAGLYAFLSADFLAAAQVLIYVGGILVLLVFGVMLTHRVTQMELKSSSIQVVPAGLVALALLGLLAFVIYGTPWNASAVRPSGPTTEAIGRSLLTDYALPFEVSSILLLAALMGAALLARREAR